MRCELFTVDAIDSADVICHEVVLLEKRKVNFRWLSLVTSTARFSFNRIVSNKILNFKIPVIFHG